VVRGGREQCLDVGWLQVVNCNSAGDKEGRLAVKLVGFALMAG